MYGMIHRAARQMVREQAGDAAWTAVLASTGLSEADFISAQIYPDDMTFALISAIGAALSRPADELLEAFGRYWIGFADASEYGAMMRLAGDSFSSFIGNLDRMHASVKSVMSDATLPGFVVASQTDREIRLIYRSPRQGLEPFVRGLLLGLMDRFGQSGQVSAASPTSGGLEFCILLEPVAGASA